MTQGLLKKDVRQQKNGFFYFEMENLPEILYDNDKNWQNAKIFVFSLKQLPI